ncbi:hypothetical protein X777_00325 [Ooceraea biroi]|uniref:Uncharacterized protein n=1 Tax=Ooceraea biroi TaxID=2015173 RepID=A0A026WTY7_OOCBI|nr:hypothetical protein X777_00325 [Ooceraea biroi]
MEDDDDEGGDDDAATTTTTTTTTTTRARGCLVSWCSDGAGASAATTSLYLALSSSSFISYGE